MEWDTGEVTVGEHCYDLFIHWIDGNTNTEHGHIGQCSQKMHGLVLCIGMLHVKYFPLLINNLGLKS